ncbi:hypothetical protein [Actinomadura violacea]|uniref:Helix-turn-helix DNA binding domain protein n=1 Tax=Actinomadura violacea TaxID=2819934 RepID=A0ABS3RSV8_9ACTN|nr:hypothetical protein [Actinomadura violacea]MBO2459845.1 hypothetical protein [Actinomadura violacea]
MSTDRHASDAVSNEAGDAAATTADRAVLVGAEAVGRWLGVPHATVSQWRRRYADGDNPCPQPDAQISRWAGWRADRKAAWLAWDERRKTKQKAEPADYQADTVTYVGIDEVGRWLGIARTAASHLKARYADTLPPPEPDVVISGPRPISGWLPERKAEWLAWKESRPGQGAGGGPKRPKSAK